MNKLIKSQEIINILKAKDLYLYDNGVEGYCTSVSSLDNNNEDSICWIKKYNYDASSLSSNILIVNKDFKYSCKKKTIIYTKQAQLAMAFLIKEFFENITAGSISNKCSIDTGVKMGKNISIGDNSIIGMNCSIGDNTQIHSNCVIYPNTQIGSDVIINSGAKIGQAGFGYIKDLHGNNLQFPHLGSVIIKNNVEIGSNVCIDRGSLSDTVIDDYTKINNLTHIAHNVRIGKNCLITANVNISGSAVISDNVYIGPNSSIKDGVKLSENIIIGMGSIIRKDVEQKKTIVPIESFEKREYVRIIKKLRK